MKTPPKAIDRFAFRFKNYTYRPVRLCLKENQGLAATILLCCAVDLLAKFNSGNPSHGGSAQKYRSFVHIYFPQSYDPAEFYRFSDVDWSTATRWSIATRFLIATRRGHVGFTFAKIPGTQRRIINPFQLLADLQKAVRLYVRDVQADSSKAQQFLRVHKVVPLKQQVSRWKKLKNIAH